jgi:hypothetical protein
LSYLAFLIQWYNWAYLAALVLAVLSFTPLGLVAGLGNGLARVLGVEKVSGRLLMRVFAVGVGVVGLTVNGALHDYFPDSQQRGFLPGLILTLAVAGLLTRSVGRLFERQFPEIKAVGWGATDLAGREGRVVSREVSAEYPAGRAQVMNEDGTLHMVMCKTRDEGLPYGAAVVLTEYDESDRRYFVERAGGEDATGEGVELHPEV